MRQLTLQRVMLVTIFALLFSLAVRIPVDTDTWWHIRSADYTLSNGIIYEDPFSHTMQGETWINHSWGAQLVIYAFWQVAGNVGLALYMALLATAGMAVIYFMCEGSVYLRGFALVLGAATAAVFWSPRPQMVSFFLSAVVLYILFLYKYRGVDRLWFIPPLMLLWGNMHAGFSIAYIFIGGFIAGEVMANIFAPSHPKDEPVSDKIVAWRGLLKLVIVSLVSVAALVINPYGFRMLLVPFETVSIGALREFIQEWNSPNFQERQTWPFVILLLGLFGAAGASRRRLTWSDFVLVSGTAFMGLLAGRNIAVFAVVATPALTRYVQPILAERGLEITPARRVKPLQGALNLVILVLILVGALANILTVLNPARIDEAQRDFLPVQAAEFIQQERPPGPMFNSYNWGGYLMFALPNYPVYTDGRTDLYGSDFLFDYLNTALGREGWQTTLTEHNVNMIVIEQGSGLAQNLNDEPGWTQVYPTDAMPDEQVSIYTRDEPLEVAAR